MRTERSTFRLALFAAALLTVGSFGSPAKAQSHVALSQLQGKFTLPYEVHWGKAVLQPGDYQVRFADDGSGPLLMIRDAKTLRYVAYEFIDNRQDSIKGNSSLLIGETGKQRVVESLTIAELGETFIYANPPAGGRAVEEARKTQTVQVLVATK